MIHFFRTSSWALENKRNRWFSAVKECSPIYKEGRFCVLVGDRVKQSKEGRRMPGVKKQFHESGNSSKTQYIFGHLFGGFGIQDGTASKWFCIPLRFNIQDGLLKRFILCDSWNICGGIMDAFIKKGFYTISALKTNRILYPCGIKQKISEFALHLQKTDAAVSLMTVGSRSYYAYHYEGNLNGIESAVVLISYPNDAFHALKAPRAFISTDASLSTRKILDRYVERWSVEVFFWRSKDKFEVIALFALS